jgi:hypothetical protein
MNWYALTYFYTNLLYRICAYVMLCLICCKNSNLFVLARICRMDPESILDDHCDKWPHRRLMVEDGRISIGCTWGTMRFMERRCHTTIGTHCISRRSDFSLSSNLCLARSHHLLIDGYQSHIVFTLLMGRWLWLYMMFPWSSHFLWKGIMCVGAELLIDGVPRWGVSPRRRWRWRRLEFLSRINVRGNHLVRSMALNRVVLENKLLKFTRGLISYFLGFLSFLKDVLGSSTLLTPPWTIDLSARLRCQNNVGRWEWSTTFLWDSDSLAIN